MLITKIRFHACRKEGEIEIDGTDRNAGPDGIFEYLGHNELSGDLYFRCPRCTGRLPVNPMDFLGPGRIRGIPIHRGEIPAHISNSGFQSGGNFIFTE